VMQGIMLAIFGGDYTSYAYLNSGVALFGTTVAANRLLVLFAALLLGGGFYLALTRTRIGTALRAVAVDPDAAGLVAIDVRWAAGLAFALGGALAATGGVLVSMFLTFSANIGVIFTMKALIVVIMGGVGNVLGALIAGMILGLAEAFVATFGDPGLTLAATYAIFLVALLVKPEGLFGRAAR
jgi:branched-chain amino acid transport system permease protein